VGKIDRTMCSVQSAGWIFELAEEMRLLNEQAPLVGALEFDMNFGELVDIELENGTLTPTWRMTGRHEMNRSKFPNELTCPVCGFSPNFPEDAFCSACETLIRR